MIDTAELIVNDFPLEDRAYPEAWLYVYHFPDVHKSEVEK